MIDEGIYKSSYKRAEGRALYLLAKKSYGTLAAMAADLGFSAAAMGNFLTGSRPLPAKYVGYLARKHAVAPELLDYESFLTAYKGGKNTPVYSGILGLSEFFNEEDKRYIIKGVHIKDPVKFIRLLDKHIKD